MEPMDPSFYCQNEGQIVEAVEAVKSEIHRLRKRPGEPHDDQAGGQPAAVSGGEIVPELAFDRRIKTSEVASQGEEDEQLKEEKEIVSRENLFGLRREREEEEAARDGSASEGETHGAIGEETGRLTSKGRSTLSIGGHR
jgi:hypothetical protein